MHKTVIIYTIVACWLSFHTLLFAQDQTVANGAATHTISFPGTGCTYRWTNDHPEIGIAASGTGNIAAFTAVNTSSHAVTATITATPESVVQPLLYIANNGSNSVSIASTVTNSVIKTLDLGFSPWGLAITSDGSRVFVSGMQTADPAAPGKIAVINTTNNEISTTLSDGVPNALFCTLSPDDATLYVTHQGSNQISEINTSTGAVRALFKGGASSCFRSVTNSDGKELFVTNELDGTVTVINTTTHAIIRTIIVGQNPHGIIFNPDGKHLYVTNNGNHTFSVIDAITYDVVKTVGTFEEPQSLAFTPDGKKLYISASANARIEIVDPITYTRLHDFATGDHPWDILINREGTVLYEVNKGGDNVLVFDTRGYYDNTFFKVGTSPISMVSFNAVGINCAPVTYTITVNPGAVTNPPDPGSKVIVTAFTPNGDGINDYWEIGFLQNYPKCRLDIYSRSGQKIFNSMGYNSPWDGKFNQQPLPSGTYYYVIDLKDGSSPLSGYVVIIR